MKKIYTSLMMLAMALFSVTILTSCDEDIEEAMMLSGEWTGDFGMYYAYENPYTGRVMEFDASHTNLVFYPDYEYSTHGTGQQIDYYNYGPYTYRYYYFEWKVRNGRVHMYYPDAPELNAVISNYRMTDNSFSGYIGGVRFSLMKLYDFYRWGEYVGGYGEGWNDSWNDGYYYYSKGRDGQTNVPADSVKHNIRLGNRFKDAQNK